MMIELTYDPARHRLECRGHAGSGEAGHDLVCAACSMLMYGLVQSVEGFRHGLQADPVIRLSPGDALISCDPVEVKCAKVDLIFWAYLNGFACLADSYPEYVRFSRARG